MSYNNIKILRNKWETFSNYSKNRQNCTDKLEYLLDNGKSMKETDKPRTCRQVTKEKKKTRVC